MWGVSEDNIYVIHNGLKKIAYQGDKKVLRTLLQFDGKLIISIGRIISLKRFDALIEAMPALLKQFPNIKLMIVGSGPEEAVLNRLIQELGLEKHISLSGSLPKDVLFKYIHASDLLVLNSIHETFPHQLLEAMSIGTPVVATSVGGIPEIVENNKEGLLVKSGNEKELKKAIIKILTDENLSLRLTKEAKKKADNFSLDNVISETANTLLTI
jgi:glycosyltransferase involved in cell wall biosynthesis